MGALQVLNRARFAARVGRWQGIAKGFCEIPAAIWQHRKDRKPVSAATIALSRRLARGEAQTAAFTKNPSPKNAVVGNDCPVECQ